MCWSLCDHTFIQLGFPVSEGTECREVVQSLLAACFGGSMGGKSGVDKG